MQVSAGNLHFNGTHYCLTLTLTKSVHFVDFLFQKSSVKPVPPPQLYSSAAPYGGPGAPPYMGMPPYGSSVFNGSGIPPYEAPFSGGSAYPYNYGRGLPGGSPYRPLPMSGPPPYSGGSMMGNGI